MPNPAEQEPTIANVAETEVAFTWKQWFEALLRHGEDKTLDGPEDAGMPWEQAVRGVPWSDSVMGRAYRLWRVEMHPLKRKRKQPPSYTCYILQVYPNANSHDMTEAFYHRVGTGETFKQGSGQELVDADGEQVEAELFEHLQTAPPEWWPDELPEAQVEQEFAGITSGLPDIRPKVSWYVSGVLHRAGLSVSEK